MRSPSLNDCVFTNCPFDDAYRTCFEALLFTITMAGYHVRCALETDDSGDVRFGKLCELIAGSDRSIHDLSRVEQATAVLPRFNMPFELGLMMSARRFGSGRQRLKRAMIMTGDRFAMPKLLSDLAGNDPKHHGNDDRNVVRIVRDHLHATPAGQRLPGAAHISELRRQFRDALPALAQACDLTLDEVDAYRGFRNHMDMILAFRSMIVD